MRGDHLQVAQEAKETTTVQQVSKPATAATGRPGTPSFSVVRDRRCGWSRRCCSTNGVHVHSSGPLSHSFRLLQDLLELTVSQAIREACARWPEADATPPAVQDVTGGHDAHDDQGR